MRGYLADVARAIAASTPGCPGTSLIDHSARGDAPDRLDVSLRITAICSHRCIAVSEQATNVILNAFGKQKAVTPVQTFHIA